MGGLKIGEPFGLDPAKVDSIDWDLALQRVIHDLRSDFIYAPHIGFIYRHASKQLIALLKSDLRNGKYSPEVPITIEVPKSFRIRVVGSKRLGPASSRPGSILLPRDRLLYQALADEATPFIDRALDPSRSFSHQLAGTDEPAMFVPTRTTWNGLQKALREYAEEGGVKYILKVDVTNFFGSLNLHTLINILKDAGYPREFADRLEVLLTSFTGSRSSRGLLQGMYPSDLFGNYYLEPIDRFLDDSDLRSARYVDDLYVFIPSLEAAEIVVGRLIPELRGYDLSLHEGKSAVMPKSALVTEEPDLQELFDAAVNEISEQLDEEDFDVDYGFQSEWEDEEHGEGREEDGNEDAEGAAPGGSLELEATKNLFDYVSKYQGHEENIERFCLPLFSKASSDYAIDHVIDAFLKRPSMSQIYAAYLANFVEVSRVSQFLVKVLDEKTLPDWSKMWVIAALLQARSSDDEAVRSTVRIVRDTSRHDALRASAAIFVGRFGDHARRKSLNGIYPLVSPYVQSAIFFSSRQWPRVERQNAKATWGSNTSLNALLSAAFVASTK